MIYDYSKTREYSFYRNGTQRCTTVSAESYEEAQAAAAFLLNTTITEISYLPPLPPLGRLNSQRDRAGVTPLEPGATCDGWPAVTAAIPTQAREQERSHWFTCTFPGEDERIAIVQVYGAQDQKQARAAVQSYWQKCHYTVTDGDETHGHAQPFTLFLKRNAPLLRFEQPQRQERDAAGSITPPALGRECDGAAAVTGGQGEARV